MKNKIGFYGYDQKIYLTVNREIYNLFFMEKEASIDNQIINFKFGKDIFNLKSFSNKINEGSLEDYKKYFWYSIKRNKDKNIK